MVYLLQRKNTNTNSSSNSSLLHSKLIFSFTHLIIYSFSSHSLILSFYHSIIFSPMSTYKNCQSCGMPLKKDPQGGGSNADGTQSTMYCSYCYQDGNFTQPDFTAKDMQAFSKGKMKEMGFPGFLAGFFTMGIPKLARWKNQ